MFRMAQTKGREDEDTVVLATRVTPDFVEMIKTVAERETRTVSNMVHVLLREALKARGAKC